MRTVPRPHCAVCGLEGELAYANLPDRLFSAPGKWTIFRCPNRKCGLLWLNPMPKAEDLTEAYADYFTHDSKGEPRLSRAKWAYLGKNYGPRSASIAFVDRVLSILFALRVRRRLEADDQVFHLHKGETPERVLDIGCGSGDALALLSKLGWETVGVEFDSAAAAVGRARGLTIHDGDVADQRFADGAFDAVVLSHVIEHLPEPGATLAECLRILKPGGRLVMLTPNAAALGHRLFGIDWMALDPPRHLHIFTPDSMATLLKQVGFAGIDVVSSASGADRISMLSRAIRRNGSTRLDAKPGWLDKRLGRLIHMLELCLVPLDRRAGDELIAKARRAASG